MELSTAHSTFNHCRSCTSICIRLLTAQHQLSSIIQRNSGMSGAWRNSRPNSNTVRRRRTEDFRKLLVDMSDLGAAVCDPQATMLHCAMLNKESLLSP